MRNASKARNRGDLVVLGLPAIAGGHRHRLEGRRHDPNVREDDRVTEIPAC